MRPRFSFRYAVAPLFGFSFLVVLQQPATALNFFALFSGEPSRAETAPAAPTHIQAATRPKPASVARRDASKPARASVERETKPAADSTPSLPLFGVVSIADQHISVYNHNGLVTRSPVSTGMAGHGTPRGIFTIIGRERYHESNIYSGAPMPFMQRITWSGIAMHVGVVPGHPASHGCVRLPADFAAKLWGMTKIGERVVISSNDVWPMAFSHPSLPEPKMYLARETGAQAPVYGPTESGEEDAHVARLNPRQYADRLKAKAAADALSATRALKEAASAERAAQEEVAAAARELAAVEAAQATAQMKAEAADEAYLAATAKAHALQEEASLSSDTLTEDTPRRKGFAVAIESAAKARTTAASDKVAFATAMIDAREKVQAARAALASKEAKLSEAVGRLTQATEAAAAAAKADAESRRRLAPLSVLVSRKDRKVYVRQGLSPLFDAPITVADPDRPLGSHLFIATAANDDGSGLQWSALTMPGQFESAAEALERIEMAPEIRARIGERLWMGGSIIVSDQPPSNETGADGTDLTVKLR
jgi:lipoprotein-anchoring transpeptidase ErfK/SrfK